MNGEKVTLENVDHDPVVWLTIAAKSGPPQRACILLRNGFQPEDLREALLATGNVQAQGEELLLVTSTSAAALGALLEEMLDYFQSPDLPTNELLAVISGVRQYDDMKRRQDRIPLFAYAWLDIAVRNDIADDARSASGIWQDRSIELDCGAACDRRIDELLERYPEPTFTTGRLAPSVSTRSTGTAKDQRTG